MIVFLYGRLPAPTAVITIRAGWGYFVPPPGAAS